MSNNLEKLYNDLTFNSDLKDYGKTFRREETKTEIQYYIPSYLIEEFEKSNNIRYEFLNASEFNSKCSTKIF
jgi:hypothetical protein